MCFFLCVSKITSVKEAAALFEACQEILQIVYKDIVTFKCSKSSLEVYKQRKFFDRPQNTCFPVK